MKSKLEALDFRIVKSSNWPFSKSGGALGWWSGGQYHRLSHIRRARAVLSCATKLFADVSQ